MAFIAFIVAIFAAIAAFFAEVFHQIIFNLTPDIRCILRKRVIILFFAIAGSALLTGKAQIHRSFPVGIGLVNPIVVGFPGKGHARMQEQQRQNSEDAPPWRHPALSSCRFHSCISLGVICK
jgi:disulfide bond formation protein DsbB